MSLQLSRSEPKVFAMPEVDGALLVGDYRIDPRDMCSLVLYFLTNTDLRPDDPRRELVRAVTRLYEGAGWDLACLRLSESEVSREPSDTDRGAGSPTRTFLISGRKNSSENGLGKRVKNPSRTTSGTSN